MEFISYPDLRVLIHETFPSYPLDRLNRYNITPATFEKIAELYNLPLPYKELPELLAFKEATEKLYTKLFGEFSGEDGKLIVITDEFIKEKRFAVMDSNYHYTFVHEYYPETYGMSLFQPLDVLIWYVDQKLLLLVHHEGYYAWLSYN
ncbi:hypothetical protein QNI19_27420 [Cytophagaceae bacterium DM2B3-1]|uniref:SMI1/KNR4 family protein n=1 Tax=Xanthocytophaga flava TaxID=3048013 RepID=A0ABT7CSH8_9BACT|nr:hypothetical protein [Xanthocytophaga flavus]MDJ1496694.1 hypothetical protein [Xanthocytophaga flavus]